MKSEKIIGIWFALGAFTAWGFLPIYWKSLNQVPSAQILAHRIFWSLIFVSVILSIQQRWPEVKKAFSGRRNKLFALLSAILLGTNWFIYIWAVNSNRMVESSMGYFINPLINVMLGIIFLKERLKIVQAIAVLLAFIGVFYLTLQYGHIPWIALTLAISFGFYGLLKKIARIKSLIGLLAETTTLGPFALGYIILQHLRGNGAFGTIHLSITILLAAAGVVTALPLIWFANAALRIPLSMVGFFQYLAPSFVLLLAVIFYKEPFTTSHLISFCFIWCALIIYSLSHTGFMKEIHLLKTSRTNKSKSET